MFTTLCTCSAPSIPSCSPGSVGVSTSRFHSALYTMSLISELLPDPDASFMRALYASVERIFGRAKAGVIECNLRREPGIEHYQINMRSDGHVSVIALYDQVLPGGMIHKAAASFTDSPVAPVSGVIFIPELAMVRSFLRGFQAHTWRQTCGNAVPVERE